MTSSSSLAGFVDPSPANAIACLRVPAGAVVLLAAVLGRRHA
jgi:hypothetical protein